MSYLPISVPLSKANLEPSRYGVGVTLREPRCTQDAFASEGLGVGLKWPPWLKASSQPTIQVYAANKYIPGLLGDGWPSWTYIQS